MLIHRVVNTWLNFTQVDIVSVLRLINLKYIVINSISFIPRSNFISQSNNDRYAHFVLYSSILKFLFYQNCTHFIKWRLRLWLKKERGNFSFKQSLGRSYVCRFHQGLWLHYCIDLMVSTLRVRFGLYLA